MSQLYRFAEQSAEAGTISYHWQQTWFKNICLAAVLTLLLFVMAVSICLVASRPLPVTPEIGKEPVGNSSLAISVAADVPGRG